MGIAQLTDMTIALFSGTDEKAPDLNFDDGRCQVTLACPRAIVVARPPLPSAHKILSMSAEDQRRLQDQVREWNNGGPGMHLWTGSLVELKDMNPGVSVDVQPPHPMSSTEPS
jgi:hypothetical protein